MPTFQFEAMDATGREIKDVIDAPTEEEAQATIRQMGYFVTKIAVKKGPAGKTTTASGRKIEERKRMLYRGGVTIQTTLDPRVQQVTQQELTKKVPIGDPSRVGAAAYVTDPSTGKVLAFAQNTTYTVDKESSGKTGINWALDQRWGGSGGFQFGSTAKAFALVTAMESGMTLRASVNAKAAGDGHMAAYQPKDFPGGCGPGSQWDVDNDTFFPGGSISLMKATALSTNTAFVALAQQLGGCKVRDTMLRLGLHQSDGQPVGKYAPQYILGASDVSPQGVAQAYGVLAADGKKCSMIAVTKVSQGSKVLAEPKTTCTQVVDPDVVHADRQVPRVQHDQRLRHPQPARRWSAPGRRQDRYGQQQQRVVVRRLHAAARDGRLGRHALRPDLPRDEERHRRWHLLPRHARCRDRRPDLEGHHERRPPGPADRAVHGALSQVHAGHRDASGCHPQRDGAVGRRGDLDPPGRRLPRRRRGHHGLVGAQRPRRRHLALRERAQRHLRDDLHLARRWRPAAAAAAPDAPGTRNRPSPLRPHRPRRVAATAVASRASQASQGKPTPPPTGG